MTRATTLAVPADDDHTIFTTAVEALERAYTRRVRARLVGVCASDLVGGGWATLDLFDGDRQERRERLGHCLDGIRGRYGFEAILRGGSWVAQQTMG